MGKGWVLGLFEGDVLDEEWMVYTQTFTHKIVLQSQLLTTLLSILYVKEEVFKQIIPIT